MRKWNMLASLSCVLALSTGLAQAQTTYRLTELGTLGGSESGGSDLNESGQVAGTSTTASGERHAFLWNGTTMLDLGTLGGEYSFGIAINESGQVAGTSATSTGYSRAFLWNGSTMSDLGTLGGDESQGYAINDLGQVAGKSYAVVDETEHAFLWDGAFLNDLTPALPFSEARAINSSGVIAGAALDRSFAFVWTQANGLRRITNSSYGESVAINDAGWVTGCFWFGSDEVDRPFVWNGALLIQPRGAYGGCGRAINSSGWIAGNATFDNETHAFVWNLDSSTDLGTLGGSESSASDINDSGYVVGDSVTAVGVTHAFVWDGSVMRDLNDLIAPADPLAQYVTLTSAVRINNQGVILASGVDSRSGAYRTYLLSSGVTSQDADGDGIADAVDTDDGTASNGFDDGEGTSGLITDRAGLEVTIEDAASPDGVRVVVGAGSGQVTLDACGFTETVAANSELIITCGSVTVNVIQGTAQIVLEGRATVVSVGAGATASVTDNGDGTVLVQNVGDAGGVSVTLEGSETAIAPGDSQSYTVVYPFAGFFNPVDNSPTVNQGKAGSAIPVLFSLGGDYGLAIFAAGYPKSQRVECSSADPLDSIEVTVKAGASGLAYDPSADRYHYVWKTEKAWFGTCRQLIVKLNDDTVHVANFRFK